MMDLQTTLRFLLIAFSFAGAGIALYALHSLDAAYRRHKADPTVRKPPIAAMIGTLAFLSSLLALAFTEVGWARVSSGTFDPRIRTAVYDLVIATKAWQLLAVVGLVCFAVATLQMWGDPKR